METSKFKGFDTTRKMYNPQNLLKEENMCKLANQNASMALQDVTLIRNYLNTNIDVQTSNVKCFNPTRRVNKHQKRLKEKN